MMDPLIENWPLKDTCSVLSYPISTKKFLKESTAISSAIFNSYENFLNNS